MRSWLPLAILASLSLLAPTTQATQLLNDDFSGYTVGAVLDGQGSWTKGGTGPSCNVSNASALTYVNYNSVGGNYVQMAPPSSTTSRTYKGFTSTASAGNTFFVSFLLRLSAAGTGDYFISLGDPTTGTAYGPRIFAKANGGGYSLGIAKSSATGIYATTPTVLSFNQTYLVVLRFTGVTGSANDTAYLWINPNLAF